LEGVFVAQPQATEITGLLRGEHPGIFGFEILSAGYGRRELIVNGIQDYVMGIKPRLQQLVGKQVTVVGEVYGSDMLLGWYLKEDAPRIRRKSEPEPGDHVAQHGVANPSRRYLVEGVDRETLLVTNGFPGNWPWSELKNGSHLGPFKLEGTLERYGPIKMSSEPSGEAFIFYLRLPEGCVMLSSGEQRNPVYAERLEEYRNTRVTVMAREWVGGLLESWRLHNPGPNSKERQRIEEERAETIRSLKEQAERKLAQDTQRAEDETRNRTNEERERKDQAAQQAAAAKQRGDEESHRAQYDYRKYWKAIQTEHIEGGKNEYGPAIRKWQDYKKVVLFSDLKAPVDDAVRTINEHAWQEINAVSGIDAKVQSGKVGLEWLKRNRYRFEGTEHLSAFDAVIKKAKK
jgi:hypothetical protein